MTNFILFKAIGVIGLVSICIGMIVKQRTTRDIFATIGGVGLLIYSIFLKDAIFIVLQSVYIVVVVFDLITQKGNSK